MINFFLRAKHWQLFLVVFVLPVVFNMIFVGTMMSRAFESEDPQDFFAIFKWFPLTMAVPLFGIFGWVISVGIGLHKYVPKSAGMKLTTFKIFMGIAVGYFLILFIWMASLFSDISTHIANETQPDLFYLNWLVIIIPLHFFSIFAMIYALWFNAKSFKSIELGKEAHSSDYIGHFFLFWISFVGVWIIQPTINKIVDGTFEYPENSQANHDTGISENKDLLD